MATIEEWIETAEARLFLCQRHELELGTLRARVAELEAAVTRQAETIVAQSARVAELETLAVELVGHLDYCGWGDSWERECSEELQKRADAITNEIIHRT